MTAQMTAEQVNPRLAALGTAGTNYLLGWLTSAIVNQGSASRDDLAAALDMAERWDGKWEDLTENATPVDDTCGKCNGAGEIEYGHDRFGAPYGVGACLTCGGSGRLTRGAVA